MIASLATVAVTASLTGCASEDGDGGGVPRELVGTYEADLPDAAATRTISIGADRSFLIQEPGRRPFSAGPITVEDERIVLSADEFGDCANEGRYEFSVNGDVLTLAAVEDPCPARVEGLSRGWTASDAVPAPLKAARAELEAYRSKRNAICEKRTVEAEAVNATASSVGESVALRRGATVMRRTQADLAKLEVPARFAAFVNRDRTLRTDRIQLHRRLADALDENSADAAALGRELVQGNVLPTEQAEDRYFLTHCP